MSTDTRGTVDYAEAPRPTPQSITVSVRRVAWSEKPRGSWEFVAGMTAEPDLGDHTVKANLDRMAALLRSRVDAWTGEIAGLEG